MNKIMNLLACICIVLVFVEFQSLVDGPGMSFVGESFVRRLRRHAATIGNRAIFIFQMFSLPKSRKITVECK